MQKGVRLISTPLTPRHSIVSMRNGITLAGFPKNYEEQELIYNPIILYVRLQCPPCYWVSLALQIKYGR